MKHGDIVGITRYSHYTRLLLINKDREDEVRVCGQPDVSLGDYIWTQSGWAMWTAKGDGRTEQDEQLPIHRVYFDGSFGCHVVGDNGHGGVITEGKQ